MFFFSLSPLLLPGNMLESHCFLLSALAKPQHKQRRPYRAPAANTSALQRIYLNLPLALEVLLRPCRGASSACLRIHSHLRIKLLTLMLLVMLGPAPIFEPINLQELGNIGHVCEKKKRNRFRHDRGGVRPSCVFITSVCVWVCFCHFGVT